MKPQKFKTKVIKNDYLTEDVKHLVLKKPKGFEFISGQYLSIILDNKERKIRRAYSIASSPKNKTLEFCIKIIPEGLATPLIKNLTPKQEIEILGPMGDFIIHNKDKNIIFISTGTGVGPFRSMIINLLENEFKKKITLIAGYRKNILYDSEFKKLTKKYSNFHYELAISSQGKRVQNILIIDKKADYYLCGLSPMINSVRAILTKKSVPMKNIFSEKYD